MPDRPGEVERRFVSEAQERSKVDFVCSPTKSLKTDVEKAINECPKKSSPQPTCAGWEAVHISRARTKAVTKVNFSRVPKPYVINARDLKHVCEMQAQVDGVIPRPYTNRLAQTSHHLELGLVNEECISANSEADTSAPPPGEDTL